MNMLETALNNPEKSLGMQNVERCKGYSYEIMVSFTQPTAKFEKLSRNFLTSKYRFRMPSILKKRN